MKKIITTVSALMMLAYGASAATIIWGNASVSLITGLSGEAITSANYATYNLAISLIDASTGTAVSTSLGNMTKGGTVNVPGYNYAFPTVHTTGDQFYIKATMTYSGTDYYFFVGSAGSGADAGSVTPWAITAVDNGGTDTFTWATTASGASYGGASTWVAVPEPGTTALALAGLALLIRRRK